MFTCIYTDNIVSFFLKKNNKDNDIARFNLFDFTGNREI